MDARPHRGTWRHAAGIAACASLGWVALILGRPVPVLALVNLGFHEVGHLVTYPLPDLATAVMGSVVQVSVPMGIAAYFWWRREDLLGTGLCLAWAGAAAQEVGVYVADAPFQRLQLIGGEHDWAFVLGRLDALEASEELAGAILALAWILVLAAVASCVVGMVRSRRPPPPASIRPVASRSISWDG